MKKPVDIIFPPIKDDEVSYLRLMLRGVSQLCFQANELTGLFFLVAILIASPIACAYLVVAAFLAPAGRLLLGERREVLATGLPGLNPCLIALSLPAFFYVSWNDINMWVLLVICIVSAIILVRVCVAILPFPTLALPFLIIFWLLYALVPDLNFLRPIEFPTNVKTIFHPVTAVLFSLGQAIFSPNIWSGLLFLSGLLLSNWRHGLIALFGAIIGTTVSYYYHNVDPTSADLGLYGFNGVTTAVSVFVFCGGKLRLSLFGAVLATILMPSIAALDVPVVSSPFVFTTWLMLLLGWIEDHWFNDQTPSISKSDDTNYLYPGK
jgi:urea transporter